MIRDPRPALDRAMDALEELKEHPGLPSDVRVEVTGWHGQLLGWWRENMLVSWWEGK